VETGHVISQSPKAGRQLDHGASTQKSVRLLILEKLRYEVLDPEGGRVIEVRSDIGRL
jgi:hypothetical protein